MRVLVGVTGSIAAYKAIELVRLLTAAGHRVQVVMTESAQRFVTPVTFEAITRQAVLADLWALQGHEIEHVERAHDVDVLVVAPASANTIARLAHGLADDVLSAIALSTRAPLVIAPAMETGMWLHPATQANVATLRSRGAVIVEPESGALASGRSGVGRLAPVEAIAARVEAVLQPDPRGRDDAGHEASAREVWRGRKVVITAGPTYERLDPVRVLTNRSTGEMGIAIAAAAQARGAAVTLVLGPTHLSPPASVITVRVESAREMFEATARAIEGVDVLIAAAAVSDFRPAEAQSSKLKRSDPRAKMLILEENPDVLASLAPRVKDDGVVVGFAAETDAVEANARAKLHAKGCDIVIGNVVGPGVGFGSGETSVIAVRAGGTVPFGPAPKVAVAEFVLDQVAATLGERTR